MVFIFNPQCLHEELGSGLRGRWRSLDHRCIIKNKPVSSPKKLSPKRPNVHQASLVNTAWLSGFLLSAPGVKKAKEPAMANRIMRLCPANLMFSEHFASIHHPPSGAGCGSSLRARDIGEVGQHRGGLNCFIYIHGYIKVTSISPKFVFRGACLSSRQRYT